MNANVMVALSVLNTENLEARVERVRNLYSEYGNGDASKAHAFHEACEYFYIHIGEAEKEHKAEASAVCQSEADFDVGAAGFNRFINLTARYWAGVNTAMLQAG
ncbi:MAG: hypothetical protein WCB57_02210 [Pseudonocardiaceae bacterium]